MKSSSAGRAGRFRCAFPLLASPQRKPWPHPGRLLCISVIQVAVGGNSTVCLRRVGRARNTVNEVSSSALSALPPILQTKRQENKSSLK